MTLSVSARLCTLAVFGLVTASIPFASAQAQDYQSIMEADVREMQSRLRLTPKQKAKVIPILQASVQKRVAVFNRLGVKRGTRPPLRTLLTLQSHMNALRSQDSVQLSRVLSDRQMYIVDRISQQTRQKIRAELLGN